MPFLFCSLKFSTMHVSRWGFSVTNQRPFAFEASKLVKALTLIFTLSVLDRIVCANVADLSVPTCSDVNTCDCKKMVGAQETQVLASTITR